MRFHLVSRWTKHPREFTLWLIMLLVFGMSANQAQAQNRITETLGRFDIQPSDTSSLLNGQIVTPRLLEDEGILQIKFGPKLKAYIASSSSNEKFLSLTLQGLEYDRAKSRVDLTKSEFTIRYKADYLFGVKSNRHVIELSGLTDFERLRTTVRLTISAVNIFTFELKERPTYKDVIVNRRLKIQANVDVFRVELFPTVNRQAIAEVTGVGKDSLYEISGEYKGRYLLKAHATGFQPIELTFDWGEQAEKDVVLTFSPLVTVKQPEVKAKKRRPLLWITLLGALGGGAYFYLSQGSSSDATLPAPPGRPN